MVIPGVPHYALGVLDRLSFFHLCCESPSIKLLEEFGIYSLHSAAAQSASNASASDLQQQLQACKTYQGTQALQFYFCT